MRDSLENFGGQNVTVNVKQNLLLLRTLNPAVVTKGVADLGEWAANMIELLAFYVETDVTAAEWDARVKQVVLQLYRGSNAKRSS
jgi:hypothetical protein